MATFNCNVVSASDPIYSGEISMLIATGVQGELGIMPGHIPLVTLLKPGAMRMQLSDGSEELVYISGGVLEVQPNTVTVLADNAVRAQDLDEAKIMAARKEAESLLAEQKGSLNTSAALASLAESAAQLATLQKLKNRA